MSKLHYIIGDATKPVKTPALIIHVCNDVDKWGRGFVLALRKKFLKAEEQYHNWFKMRCPRLGDVQFVEVTPYICVANMIAQHGIYTENGIPPIRYEALEICLKYVYVKAFQENFTVHGPRIGAALEVGTGIISKV